MVGGVAVVISPRAAIPVGKQQDALLRVGVDSGYDVAHIEYSAVECLELSLLFGDIGAEALELAHQIVATSSVGGSARHTRPECALSLHERVGAISIETHRR